MSVKLIKWHLIEEPRIDFLIKTLSSNAFDNFTINVSDQEKVVMKNDFEVFTRVIKEQYKKSVFEGTAMTPTLDQNQASY